MNPARDACLHPIGQQQGVAHVAAGKQVTMEPQQGDNNGTKKRYYSVKEAAEILGVDDKTVYKAVQEKRLSSRRVGRRILIPRWAIDPGHGTHEVDRVCTSGE